MPSPLFKPPGGPVQLDARVVTSEGLWVSVHTFPKDKLPETPTIKVKGQRLPADRFSLSVDGGVIVWTPPLSIYAPVSIWDGETKVWEWTAAGGEVAL